MQILLLTMMSNKHKMLIQSKKQLIIFNLNIYVIKIFVLYLIPININITLNNKKPLPEAVFIPDTSEYNQKQQSSYPVPIVFPNTNNYYLESFLQSNQF